MIHDEHPEVEGGSWEDAYPEPKRVNTLGRIKEKADELRFKVRWLPAMVYRVIADPTDEEGITRGLLKATFFEEQPYVIDSIVDALVKVGIVRDDGHNLTVAPYEDN